MPQNKNIRICEYCNLPYRVKSRNYRTKFCCRAHYVDYKRLVPKPPLDELVLQQHPVIFEAPGVV